MKREFGKLPKVTEEDKKTAVELTRRIDSEIRETEREIEWLKNQIVGMQLAKTIIEQSTGV